MFHLVFKVLEFLFSVLNGLFSRLNTLLHILDVFLKLFDLLCQLMVDSLLEPASNELQLSGLVLEFLAECLVLLRHSADLSQLVLEITQQLLLLPELYLLLVDAEQLGEDGVASARG